MAGVENVLAQKHNQRVKNAKMEVKRYVGLKTRAKGHMMSGECCRIIVGVE